MKIYFANNQTYKDLMIRLRSMVVFLQLVLLTFATSALALLSPLWTISDLRAEASEDRIRKRAALGDLYPAYNFSVPIDHFHNDSRYKPHADGTFPLRYWFDDRFYREGGPVIVLAGGETSGEDRLPFLQKGILAILAEATGGIGVVLEHRYYGGSFPVANLSTESLRFLTTDQAMADTAYFATYVQFPGLEHLDLSAVRTPWIAYGGSYAGAFVAFLRKLYPNLFWGAISSSGVTTAVVDYWEYYEAARYFGPQVCASATQKLVHIVDNILLGKSEEPKAALKKLFGMEGLPDTTFVHALGTGVRGLQETNWDPEVSVPTFYNYCDAVSSSELLNPDSAHLAPSVKDLVKLGGYEEEADELTINMLNLIGFHMTEVMPKCKGTAEECFDRGNADFYAQDDLEEWTWRAWLYQVCTQWGYFITGSGVPGNQLPMISRLLDMDYARQPCKDAFNIKRSPDVGAINKHGGFDISYPRLAIIDGEMDPWRAATPHKLWRPDRDSTLSEPFLLIDGGVHHWDENGVFQNETREDFPPRPVREAQYQEVDFVKEWVRQWKFANPVVDKSGGSQVVLGP